MSNIILATDSYKVSHWLQYPPGSEYVYSYYESRGGKFPATMFFGLQYILKKHLVGPVVTQEKIDEAKEFFAAHFGSLEFFNEEGWNIILNEYGGHLPLQIKAVAEGTIVPNSNVLMTVINTDERLFWLTNYVETLLCQLWYPITVATQSAAIRSLMDTYATRNGTPEGVGFKLHDFGFRGVSSTESAGIGGLAHLVNFLGTDTMEALKVGHDYYNAGYGAGFSIPAAEHSTITSWGRENEVEAYRNMIKQYGHGALYAVVSDSYNIFDACANLWGGELRDEVLNANGTLVVRPDSGDPVRVVLGVLEILGDRFGTYENDKGYRVLNDKVRVIQGDGVNFDSIDQILAAMDAARWSIDNIAFGMGGALLQKLDRDTQKFAFKASAIMLDGQWQDVYKDPITAPGKGSKRGLLSLYEGKGGVRFTGEHRFGSEDLLHIVFHNGLLLGDVDFDTIRQTAVEERNATIKG